MVEVDASDTGAGAILSQRSPEDGKLHPCAFFSHRLSPAERNYDVGNRELLPVKLALEEWHHWLEGADQPFLVWTDHKNLAYIQTACRLNSRQASWALFCGRFDFTLSYRPGTKNGKPDALSRCLGKESKEEAPEYILPTSQVVAAVSWRIEEEVRAAQQSQPDPGTGPMGKLFVSASVTARVLQWAHSSKLACHPGVTRTLALLRRRFWWPAMEADTRGFVSTCTVCAQNKMLNQPSSGLLQPLPIPRCPCSHIALEFITCLPASNCNTVILTVIDCFMPKLPSARETAEILVREVFSDPTAFRRTSSLTRAPSSHPWS